jgi:hypothetical protein
VFFEEKEFSMGNLYSSKGQNVYIYFILKYDNKKITKQWKSRKNHPLGNAKVNAEKSKNQKKYWVFLETLNSKNRDEIEI